MSQIRSPITSLSSSCSCRVSARKVVRALAAQIARLLFISCIERLLFPLGFALALAPRKKEVCWHRCALRARRGSAPAPPGYLHQDDGPAAGERGLAAV